MTVYRTRLSITLPVALVTTAALSWAAKAIRVQTIEASPLMSNVLLPHLFHPDFTDCMGNAIFLEVGGGGISLSPDPNNKYSDRQTNVISERVAQIMASRQERVVYVLGDQAASYGDVAGLVLSLHKLTKDLNIVLVSQADIEGLRSGLCLSFGNIGSR